MSRSLLEWAAETGRRAVRAWRPHRQVAFGRRDANREGYDRARRAASERGYPPVERETGGRAVAHTGRTVAFALADPATEGIDARYDRVTALVRTALSDLGVETTAGEPPDSFCPGTHSLQANGKVVGIAQRVRRDAALTGGIAVADDPGAVAAVLDPVYAALDVPFDPDSVGSVAAAGGPADPDAVARAIESGLAGDGTRAVVDAADLAAELGDPERRGDPNPGDPEDCGDPDPGD